MSSLLDKVKKEIDVLSKESKFEWEVRYQLGIRMQKPLIDEEDE